LDVRTAEEFKTGHIKNALQANYNNTKEFKERVQYLNKDQPIYIYCLSGVRSEYAMSELKEMGFTKLFHLKVESVLGKEATNHLKVLQKLHR